MKLRAPIRACSAILMTAVMLLIGSTTLFSAEVGILPRSALPGVRSIDTIERREMPWVDVEALLAEDAERDRLRASGPARFAKDIFVAFTPNNSGTWETLDDGSRLWRLRIASAGALSLNLGLELFDLPEGAAFWVHEPNGSGVQGPYTRKNRNALGGLWTAVVLGDEVVAELQVPKGADADLRITKVNHGYRFFGEREAAFAAKRGSCNINVICPQGDPWRDQIRSVARIHIVGIGLCTGQLVNNTAEDLTPFLLTAQHCVEDSGQAASLVVYWNYQTPECDDVTGGNLSQNQSGSTLLASSDYYYESDFALVELDDQPLPSFNVYYSGWDARARIPSATTAIHHPNADEKSITFDYDPPTITSYLEDTSPGNGDYFRIGAWDEGTTESGSSGGCLFDDATKRCVGTLSGGFAACEPSGIYGPDESDWYARTYAQWTGEGTPETRLSDWLDPLDSGALFINGKNGTGVGSLESWLIPAVASRSGVGSTDWRSQIGVVNPTAETRSASVYFVATDQAWPGELLSGPHVIEANESLYLDDVLQPERPASGLLYVTVNGTGTAAFCRTFTPAPEGGTFGQGQPGILLSSASSETQLVLPLIHSAPDVFRTNVGFAQTSTGTYRVRVEIYSAAGEMLAQKSYSQATAWRQVNDIFANMGIGSAEVEGGWIRVTLTDGSPSYWTTYATVIDDQTGDPTYVLPVAP